ncbi:hypothetical protein [Agromyces sp. SYSU T00194]|uniref:hypothetical protein n=1 Tax=Agromyces chitinivorans TaxID=3158560 RepID=UPI00339603B4
MTRSDDDALRWAGDDDADLAPGWTPVGEPSLVPPAPEEPEESSVGAAALVLFGVFAGVYLLFSAGWALAALDAGPALADPVALVMYDIGRWLAVLAAPLWFAGVLLLARGRARLWWLLAGVVVLVPLPFLMGGGTV